ncbi:tetratricopeptide repeat protein [Woodsholea maritima]|uniref:tetratricopeptide repeat protein n=1 Tax=Woodsholea maritima TaxID=240237 RepID=UPI00039D4355|nr:tetratricopeptide repeat protein [Woodsholea maritima]
MQRSFGLNSKGVLRAAGTLFAASVIALSVTMPSEAQRGRNNNDEAERNEENRSFSAEIGQIVLDAQTALSEDNNAEAIRLLTSALQQEPSPYETGMIYNLRARAYFAQDNLPQAIRDFLAAINNGAFNNEEIADLRIAIGQMYLAEDQINEGIQQFELALQSGVELSASLAKKLAQAYVRAERFREGLQYAEFFYNNEPNKVMGDYSLMQYYYNQLERPQDELRVVREIVNRFPGERTGWQNLVALYARTGQEPLAFEVNKLMYLNGLTQDGRQVVNLVQYYSFYENPYRGASILEREMNAGTIENNRQNLELLANLWRQAQEWQRALGPLERLAEMTGSGDDARKLGEAYFQLNQNAQAETWLARAVERGGFDRIGNAWTMLGNARYNQNNRQGALRAWREGARYPESRRTAQGWIQFVVAQIENEGMREYQRRKVVFDECDLTIDAEKAQAVLLGNLDEDGRVRLDEVPERCQSYFNVYGELIPGSAPVPPGQQQAQAEPVEDSQEEASESEAG